MFELIRSIRLDTEKGRGTAEAFVPADHPLFGDHFPGSPLLPGSLMIELAAQLSGPLAEELAKSERWAILGMIRDARFLHPVFLPATLELSAEVVRLEPSNISTNVLVEVNGERVMQAHLVMMMVETSPEWAQAIEARNNRLARWKAS